MSFKRLLKCAGNKQVVKKSDKFTTKYAYLILILGLVLSFIGCAGKSPTLGRTQSSNAPELYAQAKNLEENARSEADMQNAVAAYTKAVRAGSPEAACALAELYLNGAAPVQPGKDESAQETADKAAFSLYLQAARAGYIPAQYKTAVMYADERGVKRDMAEARAWLLKAGEAGSPEAQLKLGDAYYEDCGCGPDCNCGSSCCFGFTKNYTQAKLWYERLAASNDQNARAQGRDKLADLYARGGEESTPDYAAAANLYESAAAEGDASAQSELAFLYFRGRGVPHDYEKAVSLHEDLVERYGESEHGYNMAVLYYYAPAGKEQALRRKEAFRLFKNAADNTGRYYAQSALGECYENGVGVARNYAEAAKWYKLAADQGFADAQFLLGELYRRGLGVKRDYNEALHLFEQASNRGLAWGYRGEAGAAYRGEGMQRDYTRALGLYTKAAEGGDQEAMFMLGQMYERGEGTGKDAIAARKWYRQAAEYPASESHYWEPEKVAEYNAKGRAALQRLGGE